MDSTQWEVVTKSKKYRNLEKKIETSNEKKRLAAVGPKLEEILPREQYCSMVSNNDARKIKNPSPTKSFSSISSSDKSKSPKRTANKDNNNKKPQQQQTKNSNKPKSLEVALRSMTLLDFESHLEILQQTYPGSELLWLRGMGIYFNTQLPFECDPIFSRKSIYYPSILLTKELKEAMVTFLDSMGEANLTYFYHSLLSIMCMDMSKNFPVVGYKLFLQLIGQNWPQICSDDMAKTAMLRNSYQNRSNICLSIFWAISQGGYQNLEHGIKVWQNLMLPNLEMRSYTKFTVDYIEKILNTATNQMLSMDQQTFFYIYKALRTNYGGIPMEYQESLKRSAALFLQKYIACSTKHSNIFLQLFRDIKHSSEDTIELDGCLSCLLKGDDSFKVWKMNLKKQIVPSTMLLDKIVKEWKNVESALGKTQSYRNFLDDVEALTNEIQISKKKVSNLNVLVETLKNAQQTSSQQKKKQANTNEKKCGCCKWMLGSIFLIGLIAGGLIYDTNVNGRGVFAGSATGKALKNAGLLPHVEKAWYTSMSTAARGYKWAEVHVPPYAKPAGNLACDLYKAGRTAACNVYGALSNYVAVKLPVAGAFLEEYIPGLPSKIESFYTSVRNLTVDFYNGSVNFVYEKILIGSWSPDNIRKALNNTQNAALDYYYVFHKKVDAYAKLK